VVVIRRKREKNGLNYVKIFKGLPPPDAPSKLVQLWYKSFQTDLVLLKTPTNVSIKTITHDLVRRIRRIKISGK